METESQQCFSDGFSDPPPGKGVQQQQAFGRFRGSFSTRIHVKTDLDGNPLDFHLTGGDASDSAQFPTSIPTSGRVLR